MSNVSAKNVPVQVDGNVPAGELGHVLRSYISQHKIQHIAIEKYRSSGKGITFEDVTQRFSVKKRKAQRSLKHFHAKGVLFTAHSLITQGIYLIQNTSPQQYFPACIKAEIIENLGNRKRNVLVEPTGVNLHNDSLYQSLSSFKRPLSSSLENQKAEAFLDVLVQIPFVPLYIHKLQLMLNIDKKYYRVLSHREGRINRAKRHEETIGRRHVNYTFSPNGSVQIAIRSSDTPFKLETDDDEVTIFSFLGQVRDRFLYLIGDLIPIWILKACDLNKDIELNDKAQLTIPDIQLKRTGLVFRLYVKSLQDRAVCRAEESVKLNLILPEALDNIIHPYKSIESKLLEIDQQIKEISKFSVNNNTAQRATSGRVNN
jgi:hypothetical protein